jgi:hypothetical protein
MLFIPLAYKKLVLSPSIITTRERGSFQHSIRITMIAGNSFDPNLSSERHFCYNTRNAITRNMATKRCKEMHSQVLSHVIPGVSMYIHYPYLTRSTVSAQISTSAISIRMRMTMITAKLLYENPDLGLIKVSK